MKLFKTLRRRGLALFLVLTMCISMLPATALAAEMTPEDNSSAMDTLPPESGDTPVQEESSLDKAGDAISGIGQSIKDGLEGLFGGGSPMDIQPEGGERCYYDFYAEGRLVDTVVLQLNERFGSLPQAPVKDHGEFAGWFLAGTETEIRADGLQPEGATVSTDGGMESSKRNRVDARYTELYDVTFMDAEGGNVLAVLTVPAGGSLSQTQIDSVKFEAGADERLSGWVISGTETAFTAGTEVTSNLTLVPAVTQGYWVTFDTQGGTAMPRGAVGEDGKVAEPTAKPTKPGYTFAGWYKADDTQVDFVNDTFSGNETIYAHWTASEQTRYTVRYWAEKVPTDPTDTSTKSYEANPGDYEQFRGDEVAIGATGETVRTLNQKLLVKPTPADGYLDAVVVPAEIKADGSTVVNVYYNRAVYVLDIDYFYAGWKPLRTISAKYGANIAPLLDAEDVDKWPFGFTVRPERVPNEWDIVYSGKRSDNATRGERVTLPKTMPAESLKYDRKFVSGKLYVTAQYWLELMEGEQVADGVEIRDNYKLYNSVQKPGNSQSAKVEETDKQSPVEGYTFASVETMPGTDLYEGAKFYFDLVSNPIQLVVVGGSEPYSQTIPNVKYGTSLKGLLPAELGVKPGEGYEFSGWCTNEACTMPVQDTATMPATAYTLYGTWRAEDRTVTVMNEGKQLGTFQVPLGSYLTADQLAQYQDDVTDFLKWVVDGKVLTGEGVKVEGNLTVYARTASSKTTVSYALGDGTGDLPKGGSFAEGTAYSVASGAGLTKDVDGKKWIFSHWTDASDTRYDQGQTITIGAADITLTAQYIDPDSQKADLTDVAVVYKNYDGSEVGTATVTNNVEFNVLNTAPKAPTAPGEGYNFVGWKDAKGNLYTSENAIARANGENPSSNVLTAQWTATVTVKGNSETKTYNGSAQTSKDYEVTSAPAGVTVTQKADVVGATGTDVGNYNAALKPEDFTVTGNPANTTVTVEVTGDYTLVIDPAVIESVAVQVTAPVASATPQNDAQVDQNANYTAGTVNWDPTGTFGNGIAYTATVTLTPKANYTFAEGVTGTVNGEMATVTENNDGTVTVTYTFPRTKVVVTWVNDGSNFKCDTVNYGTAVSDLVPTNPSKAQTDQFTYTFAGWSATEGGTVITDWADVTVTSNVTYYAVYTPVTREYTITWKDDDGTVLSTAVADYGTKISTILPDKPERTDYVFTGWTPIITETSLVTGDATYTAQWKDDKNNNGTADEDETKYTVVYMDGDTAIENGEFTGLLVGENTPKIANPTKRDYVFAGWNPEVAEKVAAPAEGTTITYTAQWKDDKNHDGIADETQEHYTITYSDGADGAVFETVTIEDVLVDTAPPAFDGSLIREGYVFTGWNPEITAETKVSADTDYVATWAVDANGNGEPDENEAHYTVSYSVSGTVPAGYTAPESERVVTGGPYTVAAAPASQAGTLNGTAGIYSFSGWSRTGELTVTEDITITGTWTFTANLPDTYTVTYTVNGDVPAGYTAPGAVTVTRGGSHTVAAAPASQNGYLNGVYGTYTFSGWSRSGSLTVTGNVTITGTWTFTANPGGGGGGGTTPVNPVTPVTPVTPNNPSDIPDNPTPLGPDAPINNPTVDIGEEDTPLGGIDFGDVNPGDWFYDAVKFVFERGLMLGVSENEFGPNLDTTRGMIVTILYRMEGTPAAPASPFTDVAAGQWYYDAIGWAAANDIVNGYGDGRFGPLDTITREQMAAIFFRYAQFKGYDVTARADLSAYTDAGTVSEYAVEAMQWAVGVGLINGMTTNTLVPRGHATRAQVATILMRFCLEIADEQGDDAAPASEAEDGTNPDAEGEDAAPAPEAEDGTEPAAENETTGDGEN